MSRAAAPSTQTRTQVGCWVAGRLGWWAVLRRTVWVRGGAASQTCDPGKGANHQQASHCAGNLLATRGGDLVYLDFGMMSEAPQSARYAIIAHVVHLVNRDYLVRQRFIAGT